VLFLLSAENNERREQASLLNNKKNFFKKAQKINYKLIKKIPMKTTANKKRAQIINIGYWRFFFAFFFFAILLLFFFCIRCIVQTIIINKLGSCFFSSKIVKLSKIITKIEYKQQKKAFQFTIFFHVHFEKKNFWPVSLDWNITFIKWKRIFAAW
jgi:hypothetical protein